VAGLCTLPSAIGMAGASAVAWRVGRAVGRRSVTLALAVGSAVLLGTLLLVPAASPARSCCSGWPGG